MGRSRRSAPCERGTAVSQPPRESAADVAVIGLGAIGLPVAVNLAKAGFVVQVWNRTGGRAQRAIDQGAVEVGSPADIDARVVLTVLPDTPQLDEVLAQGLESALSPGDVLVVMSTVSPQAVRQLGERLGSSCGAHVVDAPVSGGDVGAWDATLSIMIGGEPEPVAVCWPIFEAAGSRLRHLGPLGSGQVAKLSNQIIVGATLAAIGEAINLARAAGLDDRMVVEALSGGLAGSRALDTKGEKILSGDFTPGGAASHQLKDLRYATAAASELGLAHPLTAAVTELYEQLIDSGFGELDQSAIALLSLPPASSNGPSRDTTSEEPT